MKRILLNISFIAALVMMVSSCVDPDPDYKDFPSKDVDFTYAVAPSADGQVQYGQDWFPTSSSPTLPTSRAILLGTSATVQHQQRRILCTNSKKPVHIR